MTCFWKVRIVPEANYLEIFIYFASTIAKPKGEKKSLKWNGTREILETQWQKLRISQGLQAILKARSEDNVPDSVLSFFKPFTVKGFVSISVSVFSKLYSPRIRYRERPSPVTRGESAKNRGSGLERIGFSSWFSYFTSYVTLDMFVPRRWLYLLSSIF